MFISIATITAKDGSSFQVKQAPGESKRAFSNRVLEARLPGDTVFVQQVKAQPWMSAELN